MLAAELETPRITLLLLLDANDTPVAVTASTSCAVSVPTTHDANSDGALLELIDRNVGQGGPAALRRPVSADAGPGVLAGWRAAAGGCAKKKGRPCEWSSAWASGRKRRRVWQSF